MTVLPTVRAQLLDAVERGTRRRRSRIAAWYPAGSRRFSLSVRGALTAAAVLIPIVIAGGALLLLGSHSPTATETDSLRSTRQQLIDSLAVLRRPQTTADTRQAVLPSDAVPECPRHPFSWGGPCQHAPLPASEGYPRLDRALVRTIAIRQWHTKVTLAPISWQPSRSSHRRVEALDIAMAAPFATTPPPPSSIAELRDHGLALATSPASGVNLVLMVVPDGITRVTLGPFRVDPAMSSIATVTAAVHDMTWYVSNGGVRHIAFDLWLIVGAPRGRR
jgi:hypothetical protein